MKHRCLSARLAAAAAWIITLLALLASAADKPGLTGEQAWRCLKEGNERFAAGRLAGKDVGPARRKELTAGQQPFAVVLSCADSRVPPEIIFDQGLGEIFVVRVAGNISEPFALGSIDYAVEHLHVPLIVVLGHEKCGAVAAALGKEQTGRESRQTHRRNPRRRAPSGQQGRGAGRRRAEQRAVQAELLTERSDVIREHVKQKKLQVVAGVYRLASGKVRWLEPK